MHKILTDEEISRRAYEIYLNQGGEAADNWFRARRELEQEVEAAEAKAAAAEAEAEHQARRRAELWPEK